MSQVVNINGNLTSAEEAKISVFDRGFLFGDSVYETMRTYHGKIFLVERHLKRLQNSAAILSMKLPMAAEELRAELDRTIQESRLEECYVRLIVTRGTGRIGLDIDLAPHPNYIIIVIPFQPLPKEYYEQGIKLALVSVRRNNQRTLNPSAKTSNLLNNILAYKEAKDGHAFEGVFLNLAGSVTEGTGSNVFLAKDGVLMTPYLEAGLLPGVTRGLILELAGETGIEAKEMNISPEEFLACEECFITGTTKAIVPVRQIDEVQLIAPGPLTKRLMIAYRDFVRKNY